MPRKAAAQTALQFPVRKGRNTRTRAKAVISDDTAFSDSEVKPSPRRTSRLKEADLNMNLAILIRSNSGIGIEGNSNSNSGIGPNPGGQGISRHGLPLERSPSKRGRSRTATPSRKADRENELPKELGASPPKNRRKEKENRSSKPLTPARKELLEKLSATTLDDRESDDEIVFNEKSPVKAHNKSSLASSKTALDDNESDDEIMFNENKSPVKTPIKSPLAPRKTDSNANVVSPCPSPIRKDIFYSPNKPQYSPFHRALSPNRMPVGASPSRRALDFSPVRHTLSASVVPRSPGVRALDFSVKPVVKNSPARSQLLKSPRLNSPRSNASPSKSRLLSPNRNSPRCRALFTEGQQSPGRASPRRRALFTEGSSSPRKGCSRNLMSPMRLARQDGQCYIQARQALHTALPDRVVGREKEMEQITSFLDNHVKGKTPGSLYISGAPGTGKTAVLSHIRRDLQERTDCHNVYINCMSFKNSQAIFNRCISELQDKEVSLSTKMASKQLEKMLCSNGRPVVLILDEVDQLDSKNQEVLYTMFEWPTLPRSRLVMVGIANALDLTDRILPRLQAQPKCKPKLLHFAPYTKDQICAVLKDRLQQVEYQGQMVLDPGAIRFAAMKVATVAGDMRKALDVCRRAIELVETEVRKQQVLRPTAGYNSPRKEQPPMPKKIGVAHIAKVVGEVYGSRVTCGAGAGAETVPLQQKLAVCSLLLLLKQGKGGKEIPMGKLHETYSKICKRQSVSPISQSEFISMCSLVEARGIMGIKKSKEMRSAKVSLKLDEGELETALQDKVLIANILQNGLP